MNMILHRGFRNKQRRRGSVYAAIDLGTNNCRLLVAKAVKGDFKVIDAYSQIVGLGAGMTGAGRITEDAMERAIGALQVCAEKIARRPLARMRSVATEACRKAANRSEFVARVFKQTGIALDVITAREEAQLAVMGCVPLLDQSADFALVFDIGGGSTELIWVGLGGQEPEILEWTSLPYGVVSLADEMETHTLTAQQYEAIIKDVGREAKSFLSKIDPPGAHRVNGVQLVGSSGTVTTLAGVVLGLKAYRRSRVDGSCLKLADLQSAARRIAFLPFEERAASPCIGTERADLLVPGCAIFEAILAAWPVETVTIGDRGIREGILRRLMRHGPTGHTAKQASIQ